MNVSEFPQAIDMAVLIRRQKRATDIWLALGFRHDDVDLWAMLCGWLETQSRKAAYRDQVPPMLRPLLWTSREAKAVRRAWHERELLPVFWSTGWGWRLRTDWRERLAQVRRWDMNYGETSWEERPNVLLTARDYFPF
jgi:hypothetical protein